MKGCLVYKIRYLRLGSGLFIEFEGLCSKVLINRTDYDGDANGALPCELDLGGVCVECLATSCEIFHEKVAKQ